MSEQTVHIINHTHWDREWFLTAQYTTRWVPRLIEKLEQLVSKNSDFAYLFDGQTLVMEDLKRLDAEWAERAQKLIEAGNLAVGPYYCQPDWQLTDGESLLRNLALGAKDVEKWGGERPVGWLVDTFGHISQAPQIHKLFDIDTVYVWRGVPQLEPYFAWVGADGTEIFGNDLFGGYRNLYGVTHAPEIAVKRLMTETERLIPYYGASGQIPLFDGYDLEDNPEDPVRFYAETAGLETLPWKVVESTPSSYAESVRTKLNGTVLPQIKGELNSGKFGAVFTGTSSSRMYLKILAWEAAHNLYRVAEPLATLAYLRGADFPADEIEQMVRLHLQNAVHDCICGVSIDQVHEKMEVLYQEILAGCDDVVRGALPTVLGDFAEGTYAVSLNPFGGEQWVAGTEEDRLYHVRTNGIGVVPVVEQIDVVVKEEVLASDWGWENEFYSVRFDQGVLEINGVKFGELRVYAEEGDTYSAEIGRELQKPSITEITIVETSAVHCLIQQIVDLEDIGTAIVRYRFDPSAIVGCEIALDTRGTNFRVEMMVSGVGNDTIYAGMPFDTIVRGRVDDDLLPRELSEDLAGILLGQRELNGRATYPFHEYVGTGGAAVIAKGVYGYRADEADAFSVILRRSVQWLTKQGLKNRIGDAGPLFYVPDAQGERMVVHQFGFVVNAVETTVEKPDSTTFQQLVSNFVQPPLIVAVSGQGKRTNLDVWQANVRLSAFTPESLRVFNPTSERVDLPVALPLTNGFQKDMGETAGLEPKQIASLAHDFELAEAGGSVEVASVEVEVLNRPFWRVGENEGLPQDEQIAVMAKKIERFREELVETYAALEKAEGAARYHVQHKIYVLERETLEYELSIRLNELKKAANNEPTDDYIFGIDDEVARIGYELNQLRIKRRIYDYIVQTV